jgi:hypothetical protein
MLTTAGAAQDFRAIDLAQDDVFSTHARDRVDHAPPIAMELGQSVQIHVAVVHAHLPSERRRVDPQIAVRQLHAFRPGGCSAGVVDRRSRIFVGCPRPGFDAELVQRLVGFGADDETMTRRHPSERFVEFRVDEQHLGAAVFDDVLHLFGHEAEVHGYENATRPAHAEERRIEASGIVADHRHARSLGNAERIETCGLRTGTLRDLAIRQRRPR